MLAAARGAAIHTMRAIVALAELARDLSSHVLVVKAVFADASGLFGRHSIHLSSVAGHIPAAAICLRVSAAHACSISACACLPPNS